MERFDEIDVSVWSQVQRVFWVGDTEGLRLVVMTRLEIPIKFSHSAGCDPGTSDEGFSVEIWAPRDISKRALSRLHDIIGGWACQACAFDPAGCEERTSIFLKKWEGCTGEFSALHGVLCLSYGWSGGDDSRYAKVVNGIRIAARLDEINRVQLSRYSDHQKAPIGLPQ